ncbi:MULTISPECIES: SipW-dependent-type signal peptide-containing protein [Arthrobacter]|uniref:Ribosomally synthesized peptide with SipW-like signal peptide n=1 Tax=Arthrobacter bambusae TaxID=1338426 RepID=A0AAW8DMT5_9MICC|nr:SipW-dependent-type signal peptide-containing protein [Arthrobacter bambusae]MDP9907658.1 putative ribosomally synthesized peptide with SipW-like signal peptide [Arthrobacter bambusae]MDQ0131920.1 putative ribosomally synthesized peptide with SipW-like signal peptide [Arthrobacter bambusae]MDQ0183275.1 putative ribosomally synthesized peptide with SipW-like signal peptide [Arthrobacter bambusae]
MRAILAGGLVLGAGCTLTLAAWNDSEFAAGTFTASSFQIESSVNSGGAWLAHPTSGSAATMAFSAAGMSPSTVNYAPIWIRTTAGSLSGTLTLQGASNNNAALAAALTYRVVRYSSGSCDSSQFTAGASYLVGTSASTVPLTTAGAATAVAANSLSPTQMCFEVTMLASADNSLQGASVTATWEIKGTSDS